MKRHFKMVPTVVNARVTFPTAIARMAYFCFQKASAYGEPQAYASSVQYSRLTPAECVFCRTDVEFKSCCSRA